MKLKKEIVLIFLGIIFAVSAASGDNTFPSAYLPEPLYTFEPVVEGSEVVHEFIIQNVGTAPLEIINLKSG